MTIRISLLNVEKRTINIRILLSDIKCCTLCLSSIDYVYISSLQNVNRERERDVGCLELVLLLNVIVKYVSFHTIY